MAGFLLTEDATAARGQVFDDWIEEQKRNAARVAEQAQAEVDRRAKEFQDWVNQQQQQRAAAAPSPAVTAVAAPSVAMPSATTETEPAAAPAAAPAPAADITAPEDPEVLRRAREFQDWISQQTRGTTSVIRSPFDTGPATAAPVSTEVPAQATGPAGAPQEPAAADPMARATPFLGQPYVWGGKTPQAGFDCSGLAGYLTTGQPESTTTLYGKSATIGQQNLQPGDLVFYNMGQSDMHLQHVGVYIGEGKLVQAGGSARTVNVADINQQIGSAPEFRRLNAGTTQQTAGEPAQARGTAPAQGSATRTTAEMSGGGPAGNLGDRAMSILSDAADAARAYGDDAVKAVQAVLVTEGGMNNARGDNSASAGPLQFFGEEGGRAGQLNNFARAFNMTLAQARDWVEQNPGQAVRWAIGTPDNPGYLGKAILAGRQAGKAGADLATYIQQHGQVSVSPERAGQNWQNLFGEGQDAVTSAVTGAVDTARQATSRTGELVAEGSRLATEGAQAARSAWDQLTQMQAQTRAENDRYEAERRQARLEADRERQRQDELASQRRLEDITRFGANAAAPPSTTGFTAPDILGGLGDAANAIRQGDVSGALDAINRARDTIASGFRAPSGTDEYGNLGPSTAPGATVAPEEVTRPLREKAATDIAGAFGIATGGVPEADVRLRAEYPGMEQLARIGEQARGGDILSAAGTLTTPTGSAAEQDRQFAAAMRGDQPWTFEALQGAAQYGLLNVAGVSIPGLSGAQVPSVVRGGATAAAAPTAAAAVRQAGAASPLFAARLGGAVSGGAAGYLTTPEEAGPVERAGRTLGGVGLGLAAPSLVEAVLTRPQIDQAVLQSLRRGGLTYGPPAPAGARTRTGVAVDLTKQGMLTNPLTHIQNMGGNIIELLRQPAALTMGGRAPEAGAGLAAVMRGLPEAIANTRLAMQGWQVPTLGQGAQYTGRSSPIFRLLSAGDIFTRTLGEYQGMASKGVTMLRDAGIPLGTPQADQYLANHAAELYREGARTGATGVFGQARQAGVQSSRFDQLMARFGDLKEGLINSPRKLEQALGVLLDYAVPFQGTPARVWQVALQRIPGITQVAGVARIGRALQRGDTMAAQKALGELTLESMIQAQIAQGIREGNITGPDDPEHPSSVRIAGQWMPTRALGGYGLPMGVMAAFAEGFDKGGNKVDADVLDRFGTALNASMEPLVDAIPGFTMMSLLAGMGRGGFTRAFTETVSGALNRVASPAVLAQAENVLDPYMRDLAKRGPEQLWEPTLARNPFTARFLPPKIDPLTGEPRERRSGGLGSLAGIQNRPESALRTEINRLHKKGYSVTVPKDYPETVSYKGAEIRLTPNEQRAVTRTTGNLLGQLASVVDSAEYQRGYNAQDDNARDNARARVIERLLNKAADMRFAAWAQAVGPDVVRDRLGLGRRTVGRLNVRPELEIPFLSSSSMSAREQEDVFRAPAATR